MIKLQDFARERGVTERAIQKHLKKYEKELDGLFERRGPNGTWLTEEACDFLRSHMKSNPVTIVDDRVGDLEAKIAELEQKLKEKEAMIERKDVLIDRLQTREEEKKKELEEKNQQLLAIESKTHEQIQQAKEDGKEEMRKAFKDLGAFGRFFWKG